jgi:hypothetical protein
VLRRRKIFMSEPTSISTQSFQSKPNQITLEQFTEATFRAVLRAIDARNQAVAEPLMIRGPIIFGIWFNLAGAEREGAMLGPEVAPPGS